MERHPTNKFITILDKGCSRSRSNNSECPSKNSSSQLLDINNNQTKFIILPPERKMDEPFFPVVSSFFALVQIFLYFYKESLLNITSEEDVSVSWKSVVTRGQVWRLFYSQFFNFGRVITYFNVVALMALGRHLERKISKLAYVCLIFMMSAVSNLLYVFLNDIFCAGPHTEYIVGFNTTLFSLRMIHIFTMDSDSNNGKGDPNLIFGFIPVHLPIAIAPWQPLLETIFFDVAIIGRCVASNISGIFAGLLFPYLMKNYRSFIMLPRNPPPPPPKSRSRHTISRLSSDSNNNNS